MPSRSMLMGAVTFVAVLVAYQMIAPRVGLPTV